MKSKQKLPLVLDDIYPHWKRLSVQGEEVDDAFSVMEEWNGIQECLKKFPYKMKLYIKEMMHQLTFPEDTNLSPPSKKVVTKGAPKRKRSTLKVSSTGRIPSRWEVIDSQRGKMHALALTPAHKLHRLLQNRFGISHTFHKFPISRDILLKKFEF